MTADTVTPEQELKYAIAEAVEIASVATRDVRRDFEGHPIPPGQPTLARLRGEGSSTVKSWLWTLLNREQIKWGDAPTVFARRIKDTFEQAIPLLEKDAEIAKGDGALRLDAVIDTFRDSAERIEKAQQAIEAERLREEQERQQRFARDRIRAKKIRARAEVIEHTYDLADHFGVHHLNRADIGNEDLSKILSTVAEHLPDELRVQAEEAASEVRSGKYSAWTKLYEIAEYLEEGDESAVRATE